MLKIFNNLSPFIEDNYREISVREYSRIIGISAPTSSRILKKFEKESILKKKQDKGYLLFRANRESDILRDLSRIYWKIKLKDFIDYLNTYFNNPTLMLFGSLAKLETKKDSDIDMAIFVKNKKEINLNKYEHKYNREIQLFFFESLNKIKNKNLKLNILNGYLIQGVLK